MDWRDEETARVIGTVMGVDVFMENEERFKEGKGYNMCTAIREMWMDGWNDGVSAGISQGIRVFLGELGNIPVALEEKISAEKDEETLKKWLKLAARAESVEEFAWQIEEEAKES